MPLIWISLAFAVGILLASLLSLPLWLWLVFAGLSLAALFLPSRFLSRMPRLTELVSRLPVRLALLLAALFLGAARLQVTEPVPGPGFIANYNDGATPVTVDGVIVSFPDVRDQYTLAQIESERIQSEAGQAYRPVEGLVLAYLPLEREYHYGDRLRLHGYLVEPGESEAFSFRDYLARQGVYSLMRQVEVLPLGNEPPNQFLSWIYALKERSLALVYQLWPDPEASLFAGILLGVESRIPAEVAAAFRDTGTAHIIAISGFNITLLAGVFTWLFLRLLGAHRRYLAATLSAVMILLYTLFVGADPAVLRACLMGGLSLLAVQVGRRTDGINALAVVSLVMAALDPYVLWDVSFQLSFTATIGLILYSEPFVTAFIRLASRIMPQALAEKLSAPVGEYLLLTLAAQLLTLGVTALHFRRISLSALLVNPLILPVQPFILVLGLLALALGLLYQPLGALLASAAWPFTLYTVRMVEWFGALPGGVLALGEVTLPVVLAFYVLLFSLTAWRGQLATWLEKHLPEGGWLKPALVGGLALAAVLTWQAGFSAPDGRLHLTLLDVSGEGRSGAALLLQTPTGRRVLINGGPSGVRLSDGLGRRLPLFRHRLETWIVANPDENHIQGLAAVLERYPPQAVYWAGVTHGSAAARRLQKELAEAGLAGKRLEDGHAFDLGGEARLQVLDVTARGAALLLEYGSLRVLLPLGVDFETMEALTNDPELSGITALLLADGGYAPSNPPELLAHLNPQLVLLSAAVDDFDGLPDEAVIEALEGRMLLRTDQNGWIEITSDGEQMWLEVEKSN